MLSNNKLVTKTAVILCGGKGTRLGDISKKIPKSLVKINKKPIIWYILKSLKKNRFNQFILPIGYKGSMIRTYLKNNIEFKDYNIQIVKTGTNSSIANRIFQIKKNILSSNFLLLNGDAIFDFNLKKIYNDHVKFKNKMTFVGCENELPYGTVGIINNKIISFNRNIIFDSVNIKNKKNFKAFIYSGISVMNINILNRNYRWLENFEKSLYPLFIKKFKCNFVTMKGFWHSIDNKKDINSLNEKGNKIKFRELTKITKKFE